MALAKVLSRAQLGLDAPLVQVEVHVGAGLPSFSVVGLPAPVVRESRERVRTAILSSGFDFPPGRITVNLAPVELSKEGGRFDLPIALGVLLASGGVRQPRTATAAPAVECFGELGLDGQLKPVPGLLLAALHASRACHSLLVPNANLREVRFCGHAAVAGAVHLREAVVKLQILLEGSLPGAGEARSAPAPGRSGPRTEAATEPALPQDGELQDVAGQWQAKRALIVAAAGGHHLLMVGPPGSGKSLLASRLPGLLPPLTDAEALEVASIASIAGASIEACVSPRPPFRSPHHTASAHAIVGGGPRIGPGEISLAHCGVLFLDELPEFDRRVLESLREPLETGTITLARAAGRVALPASFQLVAAMNPCPCGYLGDALRECSCTPARVRRYRERISGPLLDRIDLRIEVPRISAAELLPGRAPSARPPARAQVAAARARRVMRSGCVSARLDSGRLRQCCPLGTQAERLLHEGCERLALSGRGVHRLLAVSRTIADLAASERIEAEHVAEALQLRRAITSSCP